MLALLLAVMLEPRGIAGDPRVVSLFSDVIVHSGVANPYAESAAFLVRDTRGDLQCLLWPETRAMVKQQFDGAIPVNTVAIVHSHPGVDRFPSDHDMDVARQLGLPMIVLTRENIAFYNPVVNTITLLVDSRKWAAVQLPEKCVADWQLP